MISLALSSTSIAALMVGGSLFTPSALFSANEPGVWFDPSDTSTLFTDPAGTTPVTTPGNTVGLMLDKSKALALGAELVTNGDFADGTTGWTATSSTLAVVGGQLVATQTSGSYISANTTLSGLVVGATYKITATVSAVSGASNTQIWVGSSPGNAADLLRSTEGLGVPYTRSFAFVAGATSRLLQFVANSTGSSATITIDNFSVRELAGNHATQATLAARPTYSIEPVGGRRNLLLQTEGFNESDWQKYAMSVTANAGTAPNGTLTADLIYPSSSTTDNSIYRGGFPTVQKTHSVYAKASGKNWLVILKEGTSGGAAWFDLANGVVGTTSAGFTGATITSVGSGWYRCSVTSTSGFSQYIAFGAVDANNTTTVTASGTNGILVWGAQLELGSTATAYQRVTTQHDVTEAGVASVGYLYFDGTDDRMVTSAVTPGIDKVQVFAGVRQLTNQAYMGIVKLGSLVSDAGSFLLWGRVSGTGGFEWYSTGSGSGGITETANPAMPRSSVVTATADLSASGAANELALRANGVPLTVTPFGDGGTGNFGNWPFTIGQYGDNNRLHGHLYSLITRFGPTLDASTIASTETWVAGKTGIVI